MGNNAKISYKFSPNSDSSKFKIDGNGAIKTKVILDRETKETYSFDVIATDGGATPLTGRTTVTITILDVNDNPPEFTQPSYSTTVAEDSSTGAIVKTVLATDKDKGESSKSFSEAPYHKFACYLSWSLVELVNFGFEQKLPQS